MSKFKVGDRVIWSNVNNCNIMDYRDVEGKKATIQDLNVENHGQHKIAIKFDHHLSQIFWCSENELKYVNSEKIREKLGVK